MANQSRKPAANKRATAAGKGRAPMTDKQKQRAAEERAEKKRAAAAEERRRYIVRCESAGVILIALGLICLLGIFSVDTGSLGGAINKLLFGLFGIVGYAMPVAFFAVGVWAMLLPRGKRSVRRENSTIISACLLGVALLIICHLFSYTMNTDRRFVDAVGDAFAAGHSSAAGAGAVGAILAYYPIKLLGVVGGYIFAVAMALCCLLILTRLSIAAIGERVGRGAASAAHQVDGAVQQHRLERQERQKERAARREEREHRAAPGAARPYGKRDMYNELLVLEPQNVRDMENGIPLAPSIEFEEMPVRPPVDEPAPAPEPEPEPQTMVFELDRTAPGHEERWSAPEREAQPEPPPAPKPQRAEPAPEPAPAGDVKPVFVVAEKTEQAGVRSLAEVNTGENPPEYNYPEIDLLNPVREDTGGVDPQAEMERGARILEETLASFGISAKVIHVTRGPAITRFELTPAPGVKVSRITSLSDDIALNLAAYGVRIEAPIPGKQAIGIEIPNGETTMVTLRETLDCDAFFSHKSGIVAAIGKDIAGQVILCDLAKMPHMLIAGATGSGKSVCINTIIASILFKSSPEEVRFIMVDPKVVELSVYNGIPHLLIPVVTDPKKAAGALGWAVQEMTERYRKFADLHVKDITSYNAHMRRDGLPIMPKIVIIIDELADLMAVAPGDVEERIQRIAQLARAAGMHLVIATQRPSVNVITGVIKANIPSRIAFAVASQVDSRTILDMAGAEKLLGKGDMLYYPAGINKPMRVQGAFISEEEVERIVEHIKNGADSEYSAEIIDVIESDGEQKQQETVEDDVDDKLSEAIELAVDNGQISISMLQRKFGVGYPRAGKLIDAMERRGIISGPEGSKPRRVLITRGELERMGGGQMRFAAGGAEPALEYESQTQRYEPGQDGAAEELPSNGE